MKLPLQMPADNQVSEGLFVSLLHCYHVLTTT
jgi:hypothetical protein